MDRQAAFEAIGPNMLDQSTLKMWNLEEWNVILDHFVDSFSKCEVSLFKQLIQTKY